MTRSGIGRDPAADGGPPMAIGLMSPGWPPSTCANGVASYAGVVAEGLAAQGHRVRILTPGPVREPGGGAFPVVDLSVRSRRVSARVLRKLGGLLRPSSGPETPGDWIGRELRSVASRLSAAGNLQILESEESFGMARLAADRVPLVVRLHGPWFINGPNQGSHPGDPGFEHRVRLEGEAIRAAAGVTSPSRFILDQVREFYGLALEGAEVIPNPVRLVPESERWDPGRCDPARLLFVGRFDRTKGGDVVIEAFARVLRDRPEARLTIVGPDPGVLVDGRRESLAEYVEPRLPGALTDGRIRWLGRRPPEEIGPLRRESAVTIVASRNESFAITAAEAMAAGSPLVCTRAGGAGELFEHGVHGLYVDPDDPAGLASAISTLLADLPRAATMARGAVEHCERWYGPDRVTSRTIEFYRRVIAGPEGPGRAFRG